MYIKDIKMAYYEDSHKIFVFVHDLTMIIMRMGIWGSNIMGSQHSLISLNILMGDIHCILMGFSQIFTAKDFHRLTARRAAPWLREKRRIMNLCEKSSVQKVD